MRTCGIFHNGDRLGKGSQQKHQRAAPANWRVRNAVTRAASSTSEPRATLTRYAFGLNNCKRRPSTSLLVRAVCGAANTTKSARAIAVSRESYPSTHALLLRRARGAHECRARASLKRKTWKLFLLQCCPSPPAPWVGRESQRAGTLIPYGFPWPHLRRSW